MRKTNHELARRGSKDKDLYRQSAGISFGLLLLLAVSFSCESMPKTPAVMTRKKVLML